MNFEQRYQRRQLISANRRYRKPLTKCKRFELPIAEPWKQGPTPFPEDLKQAILKLYPEVEILWHPERHTWEVYRRLHKNAVYLYDTMVHEFTLKYPPGYWLINHMQANDNYTKPKDSYIKQLEKQEEDRDTEWYRKEEDFLTLVREDYNHAIIEKQWFSFGKVMDGTVLPEKPKEVIIP